MSSGPRRQTVVFDLDGTLVAGNAFRRFVRHLLLRHPVRRTAVFATAPAWVPLMLVPRTRAHSERYVLWLAAAGMDEQAFADATREYAAVHAGRPGGRVAAAGLARLREHVARGDHVVVGTGCCAPLAQDICAVLGLEEIEVVSSTIARRRWAMPEPIIPALGEGKLRALKAAGVDFPVDHAYSDSAADLPLLRNARTPHVVDPTPREWRRLREALGADVDLLRWAVPRRPSRWIRTRSLAKIAATVRASARRALLWKRIAR